MGKSPKKRKDAKRFTDPTFESYDFDVFPPGTLQLDKVDLSAETKDKKAADKELAELQERLYELQVRYWLEKRRAVFVFEGWDAAGKGGAIKRLTSLMDPRGYKVWPIAAPGEEERSHHYLWRFATRMPPKGTIAVFDRSWYGRVLVERVEGFASSREWQRAYDEINGFESTLAADGMIIAKFWLEVSEAEQAKRFEKRRNDPLKAYKLTDEDWRNREKRPAYEEAVDEMLLRTDTGVAPWIVVEGDSKKWARVKVLEKTIEVIENGARAAGFEPPEPL